MSEAIEVVRHPRARGWKLKLDPVSGRARLTIPPRARLADALAWAQGQQGWIAAQRARLPQAQPFVPGARIPLGDGMLEIDWNAEGPRVPRVAEARLLCGGPREGLERRIENWLKREALRVLSAETAEFAARAGVTVTRVGIGDAKGRWGSCAASGAIRYSWRLLLAPTQVRRATVAHEVAHRLHMDHSPRFPRRVRRILGVDPTPARAWLKAHGASLHWYGRYS